MLNNTPDFQKNINEKENLLNQQLLNLIKYKLHPPPKGCIYEKPKINRNLNFSTLEPILSKGKKILVGDGSFSKVYLYQHKVSKIKYAIKKMDIPSFVKKTNNKNLIVEEINIQSKIIHPNIIRLFNYFTDNNDINIFLILEYASKGTLFDYIHYKKGFDESEAFYYFIQAVNSISFLHKNKIMHRDLKPENLLINNNNILKLCDFGWSVYLNNSKRETFCGTVEYMAPEIVKNEGYDFSIDVWSLGVLLYELIHSHSPFVVKDLNINKIENNIISKDLRFKKGVSLECRDLIEKLLIKDAKNRIKIDDIYKHPFILKYVNMMNMYIKLPKNRKNEGKNINNNQLISNEENLNKKEIKKENKNITKIVEIRESLSEFETIPTEPEAAKILVNFDKIVRNFTKINDNIQLNKRDNLNKLTNAKSIKNLIEPNLSKRARHKKSLSLNEGILSGLGNNDFVKNFNNDVENENVTEQRKQLKNEEKQGINLNRDNLLKLVIKKNKYDSPNIKNKKFIKKTLIEEYNNNINLNHKLSNNKYINKNINSKINSSYPKNLLITSYISKHKKFLFNNKILGDITVKNINRSASKLDKSPIINLKNSNSISFFNNNKSYNDCQEISKRQLYKKNLTKNNFKIKTKRNKLTKNIDNYNKSKNKKSFNSLKTPLSKDSIRNKFTLNLSNISVYNFCSSGLGPINPKYFKDQKYIQQINTFVIMDKSGELKVTKPTKYNKYINIPQTERKEKKKKIKNFVSSDKSNNSKIDNSGNRMFKQKQKKQKKSNNTLFLNFSKLNKYKEKRQILSARNSKKKLNICNDISSFYIPLKK